MTNKDLELIEQLTQESEDNIKIAKWIITIAIIITGINIVCWIL